MGKSNTEATSKVLAGLLFLSGEASALYWTAVAPTAPPSPDRAPQRDDDSSAYDEANRNVAIGVVLYFLVAGSLLYGVCCSKYRCVRRAGARLEAFPADADLQVQVMDDGDGVPIPDGEDAVEFQPGHEAGAGEVDPGPAADFANEEVGPMVADLNSVVVGNPVPRAFAERVLPSLESLGGPFHERESGASTPSSIG